MQQKEALVQLNNSEYAIQKRIKGERLLHIDTFLQTKRKKRKKKHFLKAKLCTEQTLPEVSTSMHFTRTNKKFMKPKKFLRSTF
jgi:hypothetical protein